GLICVWNAKAQIAPETVMVAIALLALLAAVAIVNFHLQQQWEAMRQKIEAGAAANRLAMGINSAVAGGSGTLVAVENRVGQGVTNMSLVGGRSVRADYAAGGYVEIPTVTNNTIGFGADMNMPLPINSTVYINNSDGKILVYG
ncbi:MAG: hypothetical protein N3E51_05160, partial [Candidatus Micrarchaeota archaeon]|nr:hypothetical protein [Candidatus Micrarchaeota archaeon]